MKSYYNSKEQGFVLLKSIITIIVFGFLMYFGLQVVRFYYNYSELTGLIEFQAKTANSHTDEYIRNIITVEMNKLGINADDEDLELVSGSTEVEISLEWYEFLELYINDEYNWTLYTFDFSIYETGEVVRNRKR